MRRIISEPKRQVLFTKQEINKKVSADLVASWKWSDESQGLVEWTYTNNNPTATKTGILLRNGYFFGGAFWPVYEANSGFNTQFASALTPLVDNEVDNNSPPLGVVDIGTGKPEVYFLFTLAPNQSWSMLEGGFSSLMTPTGIGMYEVTSKNTGPHCIQYDPQRVTDWDLQTQTTLQGYSPNPSTFNVVEVLAESDTPYDVLPYTGDLITQGDCSTSQPPQPNPSTCTQQLEQAISELESGNIQGIPDLISGIECLFSQGILKKQHLSLLKDLEEELSKIRERL